MGTRRKDEAGSPRDRASLLACETIINEMGVKFELLQTLDPSRVLGGLVGVVCGQTSFGAVR